ncbi:MAG: hypothetical protein D3910_11525 [Candidatus Electrothrix sp. ATG2]|nr:hypothetical protein [Candidatus Electrothrix sp. ATG2]
MTEIERPTRLLYLLDKAVVFLSLTVIVMLFIDTVSKLLFPEFYPLLEMCWNSRLSILVHLLFSMILFCWIFWGKGLSSDIWNWLPPFVFFQDWEKSLRALVVIAMASITFYGSITDLLK